MKLSGIKIEKLFGQFDYDIKLNLEEGITILTGPNGYGKTTILNIIWGLFNQDFDYIRAVPFKAISLGLDNYQTICVTKENELSTIITQDGDTLGVNTIKLRFALTDKTIVRKIFELSGQKLGVEHAPVLNFLESIKVYIIKDQRLTYVTAAKSDGIFKRDGTVRRDGAAVLNRVDLFSRNLVKLISKVKSEENMLALGLADSFPNRLLKYGQALPQDVFEKRFEALSQKQQRLQTYGISPGVFARSEYEGENRRILSVYLEDYERKTALFDELLTKLGLFLSILNKKKLVNKTIAINAMDGFRFVTSKGSLLPLAALSSGEQNEIILLYELLFNAPPNSLVLIDEPETSMHVAWQLEFLEDIEDIAKISGLSFIIATHSPDLINTATSIDLYELIHGSEEGEDE